MVFDMFMLKRRLKQMREFATESNRDLNTIQKDKETIIIAPGFFPREACPQLAKLIQQQIKFYEGWDQEITKLYKEFLAVFEKEGADRSVLDAISIMIAPKDLVSNLCGVLKEEEKLANGAFKQEIRRVLRRRLSEEKKILTWINQRVDQSIINIMADAKKKSVGRTRYAFWVPAIVVVSGIMLILTGYGHTPLVDDIMSRQPFGWNFHLFSLLLGPAIYFHIKERAQLARIRNISEELVSFVKSRGIRWH